jgi:hypothetical protein
VDKKGRLHSSTQCTDACSKHVDVRHPAGVTRHSIEMLEKAASSASTALPTVSRVP